MHGRGTVVGFSAGGLFGLLRHNLEGDYLLTRVGHSISSDGDSANYSNHFVCIPAETPYRPARRTPKPRVRGIETATVVGPSGQEIHTDKHGRIKVQFHWDREGNKDEHSSCFMRVVQPWAGPGWGFVFIPRIGMEVTVAFVQGDPDRPIATGTVYNGENLTPYEMPDEMTKSTIRTQSSPGGGGHNELSFEDAAGKEEVFLRAQKDLNEQILNNQSSTIGADKTTDVGGNQKLIVGANREVEVGADETTTVSVNRKLTVGAENVHEIGANEKRTIGASLDEKVGVSIDRMVGANVSEKIGGVVDQKIGAALTQMVGGPALKNVAGPNTMISAGPTMMVSAASIMLNAPTITFVTPSLNHLTPNWFEVIASEATVKGAVAEAIGLKMEAGGVGTSFWAVKNDGFGLSVEHGGLKMGTVGVDISTQGLALENPAFKLIS
jgi:type VI secretion system secreted protein VgrG